MKTPTLPSIARACIVAFSPCLVPSLPMLFAQNGHAPGKAHAPKAKHNVKKVVAKKPAPKAVADKGAITEAEVKKYFTNWWTHDCDAADNCKVTFDTPVRIAPATRHTFQIPPATYLCYPVKVNMTTYTAAGLYHTVHLTDAVYYFWRDSFGDWVMGKEGEKYTYPK